jgi:hypothetical protein
MTKKFQILVLISVILLVMMMIMEPALAAPGGRFSSSGKGGSWIAALPSLIYLAIYILVLPYAWYVSMKINAAERRTIEYLDILAHYHELFDWRTLKPHIKSCFQQVHAGWSKKNLDEASECMTNRFRKQQQSDYLDKWAKEGLVNRCQVKTINDIKPLFRSSNPWNGT